ncbi:GH32 C-terminal domain-containing protein [Mycoplasmopsis agassizii]|uniref:GH32 C-terminal domain-containing protein n=1 Tax=Mycoplasmopsis agassizii TaxID=33922 RepID=UPI0035285E3B
MKPHDQNLFASWMKEKANSYFKRNSNNLEEIKQKHLLARKDPYFNVVHLSAHSGLINDPNGLVYKDGKYFIFYQWSPYLPLHHVKKWGLYTSHNLLSFEDKKLGLEIEEHDERNGLYSGGALLDDDQKTYIYWTGNFKKTTDNEDDNSSIWVGELVDEKIVNRHKLFETDKSKFTRHFRDPKVFKNGEKYYLFLGVQDISLKGHIGVYESSFPDKDFSFKSVMKIENFDTQDIYMFECPDMIRWNENYFSLLVSTQGKKYFRENHDINLSPHVNVFLNGKYDFEKNIFEVDNYQIIDYGFDFYASQIVAPNEKTKMLFAWLGMPDTEQYATFEHMWAHNLSLPRELSLKDNYVYSKVAKHYYDNLKKLNLVLDENKKTKLPFRNVFLDFEIKDDFEIILCNEKDEIFKIKYQNNDFEIDKSKMSYLHGENFSNTRKIRNLRINKLEIFLDNSLIEIFINNGEYSFSSKYFISDDLYIETKNIKTDLVFEIPKIEVK